MSAQDVILGERVLHIRELKSEIAKLKAENARLRDENDELSHHFDLALLAAEDLRSGVFAGREHYGEEGKLVIVDGWNLVLGAQKTAHTPEELLARARQYLADHPADRVWIVFDGPRENAFNEDRLRVSYTGGKGPHRADRFIVDFVRMARFRGDLARLKVATHDKDFIRELRRLAGPQYDIISF